MAAAFQVSVLHLRKEERRDGVYIKKAKYFLSIGLLLISDWLVLGDMAMLLLTAKKAGKMAPDQNWASVSKKEPGGCILGHRQQSLLQGPVLLPLSAFASLDSPHISQCRES